MCKIIVLCAKSSAGKNEISNQLQQRYNISEIISYTSRPRRNGESENTYHFVSRKEIEYMIDNNEFIEHRKYDTVNGTWYYGLAKHSLDLSSNDNYLIILDIKGLTQLEEYLSDKGLINCLSSIYIDCKGQERLLRSLHREKSMTDKQVLEVVRRYQKDEDDFIDVGHYVDYTFDNNTVEDLNEIVKFIGEELL